ncbi:hypothetical protein [Paenibacillus illinoisensis]|uniref:Uncharacterized protein n=1 Tax=Paenibacillus illinoisensis TaxID=59845 RepID=A0A2W0C726_9BACL|nr:hypothetical protein [Paenibacillus illinoisensis]PYY28280.1 Uncharacterized protein PIL02S_03426 [Paenibacillus illinoisensis]
MNRNTTVIDLLITSSESCGGILDREFYFSGYANCQKNELVLSRKDLEKMDWIKDINYKYKPTLSFSCGEVKNMKQLYHVLVVDKKSEILTDTKVVASNTEEAKFEAEVYTNLQTYGYKLSDVTVIVNSLGAVEVE